MSSPISKSSSVSWFYQTYSVNSILSISFQSVGFNLYKLIANCFIFETIYLNLCYPS